MATRRVSGGPGRFRVALLLLGFLMIAGAVILRRSYGIAAAKELHDLDSRRAALVAERFRLDGVRRTASGRARLQPIAEGRLHMHVPADSQVIILQRGVHERP